MKHQLILLPILALICGSNAFANFGLSKSYKIVNCSGDDNMSVSLNAKKTTIQYFIEGETSGPLKIINVKTDNQTYISYTTEEGTLVLSNQGDTYQYNGDYDAAGVVCQ